jgi:hypothetical protein
LCSERTPESPCHGQVKLDPVARAIHDARVPIDDLERVCHERIDTVPRESRNKAGALLPIVPERADWDVFQQRVRESWRGWEYYPSRYPCVLLTLYAALAFHEYEDATFWPQFCRAVGAAALPTNRQAEINEAFERATRHAGLTILEHGGHREFVGSAVFFIGVPLSLWDGFLGICDWALWHQGWEQLAEPGWRELMIRRCGGRVRLRQFLVGNRQAASEFIKGMIEARGLLTDDHSLRLSDLAQRSILRREYFDEVPETAEFLRPEDPDSLLADRPRLIWRRDRIALHLPPSTAAEASWEFGGRRQVAGDIATDFPVNSQAFQERLLVVLCCGAHRESFRISGLHPFGLFDERRNRFVRTNRERLPATSYRLLSKHRLEITASGWVEEEQNEHVRLEDDTEVFVTRLWPVSDRPTLRIDGGPQIHFGRQQRVNLRVFSGANCSHVFRFGMKDDGCLIVERMPVLVLEVPVGFFVDEPSVLDREFKVLVDDRPIQGIWKFYEDYPRSTPEWEYYSWEWGSYLPPLAGHHLALLPNVISGPALPFGRYNVCVRSARFGVIPFSTRRNQTVEIVEPTSDQIWPDMHGEAGKKCWIWVLLSQIQDEASWEEFWIARNAVASNTDIRFNQNDWRKLVEVGSVSIRHQITVSWSRLCFHRAVGGTFVAEFAGLVNRLYMLVRKFPPLERIRAKHERGCPPCFEIHWPAGRWQDIRALCPHEGIEICDNSLWSR